MSNYRFQLGNQYKGFWNIPEVANEVTGTLYISENSIEIEFLFQQRPKSTDLYKDIFCVSGKAYTEVKYKNDNAKNCFYYFNLYNLSLRKLNVFGDGMMVMRMDVESIVISDNKSLEISDIKNCSLRIPALDNWIWGYTKSKYEYTFFPESDTEPIMMKYTPISPYEVYRDDDYLAYIFFGYGYNTPNSTGYEFSTKCFLNFDFSKKPISFRKALDIADISCWFFSTICGVICNNEFVELRSGDDKFIYKKSNIHSFNFLNCQPNCTLTSLSDFSNEEIKDYWAKWVNLIKSNFEAISSFYEALYNSFNSPSNLIKSFITCVDGLTKSFSSGNGTANKAGKKYETFNEIKKELQAANITQEHINLLETWVFRQSSRDLKSRFQELLLKSQDYFDFSLSDDFVAKSVQTRNHITHVNCSGSTNPYPIELFPDLAHVLEKIIIAYLLKCMGVSEQIGKKALGCVFAEMFESKTIEE